MGDDSGPNDHVADFDLWGHGSGCAAEDQRGGVEQVYERLGGHSGIDFAHRHLDQYDFLAPVAPLVKGRHPVPGLGFDLHLRQEGATLVAYGQQADGFLRHLASSSIVTCSPILLA